MNEANVHNEMQFGCPPVIAMDLKGGVYLCVSAGEIWLAPVVLTWSLPTSTCSQKLKF
jgi:hypothetical protein